MQFEKDRIASIETYRSRKRGVVDALVVNQRDLWVVVAPQDESIDDWLHGSSGQEVAPLLVCRKLLSNGQLILADPDPERDGLLSETEDPD